LAKGPSYRVPYRRRREYKTNYKRRRSLATSRMPRLVVRTSGRHILVQLVRSEIEGDHIVTQTSSGELVKKFDWRGGTKNTQSAYLLGLIAGHKAAHGGVKTAILDIGLSSPTKGSRMFAVARGALDAGLEVPCDSDVMPVPERIEGAQVAAYAKRLQETPPEYERRFSGYLKRKLRPEEVVEHFRETKARITEEFSG